ncbi:magnesium transporter MgtE N-terminal domain-containing protein [Clostridium culturomicium]|uniref:magnesium transporter MgtE N-terminal domain-containing protein n=1 Tax=Clostridium culturomicium TaxID=1499683 RepID=UPI00058CC6DA|nr:CBS domain-containing protein [Clostridium culturomicium]
MEKLKEFYLSDILGKYVYDELNYCIGKLEDIYVTTEFGYPRAIGYKIKSGREIENFEFRTIDIFKDNGKCVIRVVQVKDIIPRKYSYLLSKNLLDKDIVDVDGKKIVRVMDLKMIKSGGYLTVVGVESGPLAIARKIGLEGITKKVCKIINKNPKKNILSWESVQSLEMVASSLKLTTPYNKLSKLHPVDIAELIEDLSPEDRVKVIDGLNIDLASDTLEELDHDISQEILKDLSENKAKELLDLMPNDEIANMLDDLDEEATNKMLVNLDDEDESEVRDLMKYEDEVVGNIMNTEFISFNIDITAEETINILRELKPEEEILHYVYIVDNYERLLGVISLRDLIIANPSSKLKSIMDTKIFKVSDSDEIEKAIAMAVKYDLYSVPVVDEEDKLCGIAIIGDIIDEVLSPSWKRKIKKII